MTQTTQPQTPEKPPKPKGKMLLFGIIGLVLVVNLALVGRIMLIKRGVGNSPKQNEEIGVKMTLDEFLVNLAGDGDHYIKMSLALGLKKGLTEKTMEEEVPPIRDAVLSVLCGKTRQNIATAKGRDALKVELKDRINEALGEENVLAVYYLTFATQ